MVPSTLSPSQPLSRRNFASATQRAQSGSPVPSVAVAIAAITPPIIDPMVSRSTFCFSYASVFLARIERGNSGLSTGRASHSLANCLPPFTKQENPRLFARRIAVNPAIDPVHLIGLLPAIIRAVVEIVRPDRHLAGAVRECRAYRTAGQVPRRARAIVRIGRGRFRSRCADATCPARDRHDGGSKA